MRGLKRSRECYCDSEELSLSNFRNRVMCFDIFIGCVLFGLHFAFRSHNFCPSTETTYVPFSFPIRSSVFTNEPGVVVPHCKMQFSSSI